MLAFSLCHETQHIAGFWVLVAPYEAKYVPDVGHLTHVSMSRSQVFAMLQLYFRNEPQGYWMYGTAFTDKFSSRQTHPQPQQHVKA